MIKRPAGRLPPGQISFREFFSRFSSAQLRLCYELFPDSRTDLSGNGWHCTSVNLPSPYYGPRGSHGGFLFDGSSGSGTIPNLQISQSASVVYYGQEGSLLVWYRPNANPAVSAPIYEETSGTLSEKRFSLYHLSNGSLEAVVRPIDGGTAYTATYSDFEKYLGQWVFIALTYDTSGHQLYVNGRKVAEETTSGRSDFNVISPVKIEIGAHIDGANSASIDGAVGPLALYETKFSSGSIFTYYSSALDPYSPNIHFRPRGGPVYIRTPSRVRLEVGGAGDINRRFFVSASPSLFGSWTLSDSGSTVYDRSGNGRNGTIAGSVVSAPGPFTAAKYFPGSTSDYIDLGFTTDIGGEFTIIAWIKPDAVPGTGKIGVVINKSRISASIGTDFPVQLFINENTKVRCTTSNGTDTTADTAVEVPFVAGEWFPVITSFSQALGYHFIATPRGFHIVSHSSGITTNSYNWYIGRAYVQTYDTFFKGSISDVTILSRAITKHAAEEYIAYTSEYRKRKAPLFFNRLYVPLGDQAISESLALTDTLSATLSLTKTISETITLSDALVSNKQLSVSPITESVTLTDTLDYDKYQLAIISESLALADSLAASQSVTKILQESLTLTDTLLGSISATTTISEAVTLSDTLTYSRRLSWWKTLIGDIGEPRVYLDQTLENSLLGPLFMSKNFYGTALRFSNSIAAILFGPSLLTRTNLLANTPVYQTLQLAGNLLPNPSTTILKPKYRVLLDGVDVTNKVLSCTITYSIGSFTGECDIAWADDSLYDLIDCSGVYLNQAERLEVYTQLASNQTPTWVLQGRFFIEKRGVGVTYNSIAPTSWGRTRPALLSSPYAKPLTRTWLTTTTARTIVEELCAAAPLPVTLSWEIADYRVLGSNVSVEGTEPIDVISMLVATVGGVLTCGKDGTLRAIYRYPLTAV